MSQFKRTILANDASAETSKLLQQNLVTLIDLALVLKQAHWNVKGNNFRSVHLQLDEIIDSVRMATDEIAERIVTIGVTPDGRVATVAKSSKLTEFPAGMHGTAETVSAIADQLKLSIEGLRTSIAGLGELDPVSQDLVIGVSRGLEKHLWMLQAQEM